MTPQRNLEEQGLPTESPHIARYFEAFSIPSRLHAERELTEETRKESLQNTDQKEPTGELGTHFGRVRASESFIRHSLVSSKKSSPTCIKQRR